MRFVLIPGAGIDPGAWCWTIAELEARGAQALAPPPPDDPDAGPSAHADAVIEAVCQLRGPLVVVGHSLGAFAASLVADRIEVAELVLVAPMIPAPGKTAGEWWAAVKHHQAIAPLIQRLGGMSTGGPDELAEVFLRDVPADTVFLTGGDSTDLTIPRRGARRPGLYAAAGLGLGGAQSMVGSGLRTRLSTSTEVSPARRADRQPQIVAVRSKPSGMRRVLVLRRPGVDDRQPWTWATSSSWGPPS